MYVMEVAANEEKLNPRVSRAGQWEDDELKQARFEEFDRLEQYKVKVDRKQAKGPFLTVRWADEERASGVKSRICTRPFNKSSPTKDTLIPKSNKKALPPHNNTPSRFSIILGVFWNRRRPPSP